MSNRALRVVMLIQGYHPLVGGAERQLKTIAPMLQQAGVDVQVVTRQYHGMKAYEEIDGIPVHRLPIPGPKAIASLSYTVSALNLMRRLRPDVIHAHELLSPTTTAVLIRRLFRIPVVAKVLRGGTLGDLARLRQKTFGTSRIQGFVRDVDTFIVISQEIDRELAAIGVPQSRRRFIPNGVDTARFMPLTPTEKGALRTRLGLPDVPTAIFTGRLAREKRVDLILRAWAEVRQQNPEAHLLIAGDGDQAAALQQMAGEGITFLGRIDEVAPYLQAADVFVLPSEAEGLSNALLEAMACGLCCITTNVGGAPDLITHGENGWLIPPDDLSALQSGLTTLITDSNLQERLSAHSRERILADYALEQTVTRLKTLYEDMVGR